MIHAPSARHAHQLMVIRVADRDVMPAGLRAGGIRASVHYPRPIHVEPAWDGRGYRSQFPIAEALADSALSLPLFPGISGKQIERCVELVTSQCSKTEPLALSASGR